MSGRRPANIKKYKFWGLVPFSPISGDMNKPLSQFSGFRVNDIIFEKNFCLMSAKVKECHYFTLCTLHLEQTISENCQTLKDLLWRFFALFLFWKIDHKSISVLFQNFTREICRWSKQITILMLAHALFLTWWVTYKLQTFSSHENITF